MRLLLLASALSASLLTASKLPDIVVYNASPSMPQGFYARTNAPLVRGSIVTVRARDAAPAYARARHYIDANDRFLKRVAASHGDMVCAEGDIVIVNRTTILERRAVDAAGRPADMVGVPPARRPGAAHWRCRRQFRQPLLGAGRHPKDRRGLAAPSLTRLCAPVAISSHAVLLLAVKGRRSPLCP